MDIADVLKWVILFAFCTIWLAVGLMFFRVRRQQKSDQPKSFLECNKPDLQVIKGGNITKKLNELPPNGGNGPQAA